MTQTITAKLKYLRITPRKTRAVADIVRGLPVRDAEVQLMTMPRRASPALLKLLRSAVANAKNNFKLDEKNLFVREIRVDQGPKYKRWMPRARGGVDPLEKKTSHVTLVLGVSEKLPAPRFTILEKPKKKTKKEKAKKEKKPETKKPLPETKVAKKEGFLHKVFRRKSV